MSKRKNNRRSNSGWAFTKKFPHKNHPANFRKIGNSDDIDYLTFTHSDEVDMPNGEKIKTIPLDSNIDKSERGKSKSYVFPKVYQGKRSALGSKTEKYSFTPTDKNTVDKLFEELPHESVLTTGGAGQYRKRKNKKKPFKK